MAYSKSEREHYFCPTLAYPAVRSCLKRNDPLTLNRPSFQCTWKPCINMDWSQRYWGLTLPDESEVVYISWVSHQMNAKYLMISLKTFSHDLNLFCSKLIGRDIKMKKILVPNEGFLPFESLRFRFLHSLRTHLFSLFRKTKAIEWKIEDLNNCCTFWKYQSDKLSTSRWKSVPMNEKRT